jgi:hypothetical protein
MTRRPTKEERNKALAWADAYEEQHPHAATLAEAVRELRVQLPSIKALMLFNLKN